MILYSHCTCLKSCVGLGSRAWLFTHPIFFSFRMAFNIFFITLCTKLGFPQLMVKGLAHCICGHPIDLMGIHFLQCSHGREHIIFHDAVQDAFVSIVKNVRFYVSHEQTHVLLTFLPLLQSFVMMCQHYSIHIWGSHSN